MRYKNIASSSRHPYQILILALCLFSGIAILLSEAPPPQSIESMLPTPWDTVWAVGLTVGSALTLFSSALKNRVNGIIIEQVGLGILGIDAMVFAIVIYMYAGSQGFFNAIIVGAFGLASLIRWRQIQDYLHAVKRLQEAKEVNKGVE